MRGENTKTRTGWARMWNEVDLGEYTAASHPRDPQSESCKAKGTGNESQPAQP